MKLTIAYPGLAVLAGIAFSTASATDSVIIDWVTVGNPGNAAQSAANRDHSFGNYVDGYGAVAETYKIARNETTLADYTKFLNAVASTDPYKLYNPSMASDGNIAGIQRSGSSGSYTYSVIGSGARPVTYVNWFDAARYTNWLHNGQGSGDTETGAYTLNGASSGALPARKEGAKVWIPTENEWFKAAYYDPTKKGGTGGYWLHANRSDSMTSNNFADAGAANYRAGDFATTPGNNLSSSSQNYLTDAGAYGTDSQSYYGTNDQTGNVCEWIDLDAVPRLSGCLRGGTWRGDETEPSAFNRIICTPEGESASSGFRVASAP